MNNDPIAVADAILAAIVHGAGELVYVEPIDADTYEVVFERSGAVDSKIVLESHLATAVIARLACIADVDLTAPHATTAVVPIRCAGREDASIAVTVRPGMNMRADLMVLPRARASPPAMTAVELSPGATIGSYRVIERLGEGGMGTVYTVEHKVLGRRHALKVLRTNLIEGDRDAAHRFLREARAAARIHHPNIVDVYDFGYLRDGRPYFVMELLSGQSLADRIDHSPIAPNEAIGIVRQLAGALAAAHDCGVIHADVTPGNAFLVGDGSVTKLLDFGLAELVGETVRDETNNFVLGTPSYISPEQLLGSPATDRSDQYSLGVVLFEMLSGRPPYVDTNLRKLCLAHVNAPIPDVISKFGPLPPKLIDLVTTCLQKSPQARFPGMRAVLAALDDVEEVTDRSGWRKWLSR